MLAEYFGKGTPDVRRHARGVPADADHCFLLQQAPDLGAVLLNHLLHVALRLARQAGKCRLQACHTRHLPRPQLVLDGDAALICAGSVDADPGTFSHWERVHSITTAAPEQVDLAVPRESIE